MPECPNCGTRLVRRHRRRLERLIYTGTFQCPKCGVGLREVRSFARLNTAFVFASHTRCIHCGSPHVHRVRERDRIDSLSHHLASRLQHVLGAPLNKCDACRLQYYDWRPIDPGHDVDKRQVSKRT